MIQSISFVAEVPVVAACDVFIAGGGPAGMAAAWAARKGGASVFLAEKTGCFGGMGTAGLVPFFTGFSDGKNFLCEGFGRMIFDELRAADGFGVPGGYHIRPEVLKRLYDRIAVESGCEFLLEADLVAVRKQGRELTSVLIGTAAGLRAVQAKVFLDATGDGSLAAFAGNRFELGDPAGRIMPASLCSLWSNIDWVKWYDAKLDIFELLMRAIEDGSFFAVGDRHHTGMKQTGACTASANIGHIFGLDATDPVARSAAWIEGRRLLPEFEAFYRARVPGFEQCELSGSASQLGVRESRRITGDYCLTRDDYHARRRFDDAVGCFAYGIDIHPYDASPAEFERFRRDFRHRDETSYHAGDHYQIPYRALIAADFDNLLVAGRCVSMDQGVEASLRVMPGCFITGQAAGAAAALAARNGGTRRVAADELQRSLDALGAFRG